MSRSQNVLVIGALTGQSIENILQANEGILTLRAGLPLLRSPALMVLLFDGLNGGCQQKDVTHRDKIQKSFPRVQPISRFLRDSNQDDDDWVVILTLTSSPATLNVPSS